MAQVTNNTKLQKHSERSHALLSASGAGRWLNCTPSARLEDEYGERKSSIYAQEGTLAHELSELYIKRDTLLAISEQEFDQRLEEIMANELFNEEMLDVVHSFQIYAQDMYHHNDKQGQAQCGVQVVRRRCQERHQTKPIGNQQEHE